MSQSNKGSRRPAEQSRQDPPVAGSDADRDAILRKGAVRATQLLSSLDAQDGDHKLLEALVALAKRELRHGDDPSSSSFSLIRDFISYMYMSADTLLMPGRVIIARDPDLPPDSAPADATKLFLPSSNASESPQDELSIEDRATRLAEWGRLEPPPFLSPAASATRVGEPSAGTSEGVPDAKRATDVSHRPSGGRPDAVEAARLPPSAPGTKMLSEKAQQAEQKLFPTFDAEVFREISSAETYHPDAVATALRSLMRESFNFDGNHSRLPARPPHPVGFDEVKSQQTKVLRDTYYKRVRR